MSEDRKEMKFTISDLEERTGLNRRTIHFYVKEVVIKSPFGVGGAARYGEEHLLRLLLIRELQKSHLKLTGVREALDRMTPEEMRDLVRKANPPSPVLDKKALESWLEGKLPGEKLKDRKAGPAPPPAKAWNFSFLDIARGRSSASTERTRPVDDPVAIPRRTIQTRGVTWERIEVAEGVEVHLRSDLASKHRQLLEELADRIRKKS